MLSNEGFKFLTRRAPSPAKVCEVWDETIVTVERKWLGVMTITRQSTCDEMVFLIKQVNL